MSAWTTIRTLVAAVADLAGPPAAGSAVALPATSSIVEFRVRNLTMTGNPTALTLFFWRIQTGTVELLGTQVIQVADEGMPLPVRFVSEEPGVYATIGFTAGVAPTASGIIEARGLFGLTDAGIAVTVGPGTDRTITGTIPAAGGGAGNVAINTQSCAVCGVKITGGATGTLLFEGTVDGTNWDTVFAVLPTSPGATPVSSVTGNYVGLIDCSGFQQVRVRGNTITVGTATVTLEASVAAPGTVTANSAVYSTVHGALTALGITGRAINATANSPNALDTWDNAPTQAIYNFSTARGDGSVVWASNTTLTFSGPPLVSGQLCRVRVVIDATTRPLVWEQGRNAVLTIAGTTITVNALDGTTIPLPNGAANSEVMWAAQDKTFDAPTNSGRSFEVAPLWSRNVQTPVTIATALAIAAVGAGVWNDVGPEIGVQGYTRLTTWLDITRSDAVGLRFRLLAKHTNGGLQEYLFPTFKPNTAAAPYTVSVDGETVTLAQDLSQQIALTWDVSNSMPWCQLQWGATSGTLATNLLADVKVTYGFGA